MTRENDKPLIVCKIVVVFDICSSTTILEDLKATDNLQHWRNVLIKMKDFLSRESVTLDFEVYKFVGDGWILLFPPHISQSEMLSFLQRLDETFRHLYLGLHRVLQHEPTLKGITVGVDSGDLICLEMNERNEYLGRAINVASRLQGAVKELPGNISGVALFSSNSFYSMTQGGLDQGYLRTVRTINVPLRNISNGIDCKCVRCLIPYGQKSQTL
jgi:class 3 adenylate cyclase